MIETFEELNILFKEIDASLTTPVFIYVIGGAALLYRQLKKATKDIDIIVWTHKEFTQLLNVLKNKGFTSVKPSMVYSKMNLSELLKREEFRIDLFEKQVCGKFAISEDMIKRAEKTIELKHLRVCLCSNEDIFVFKTMTERPGDIEDCIQLATKKLDWNVMYEEILNQINISGKNIWITWIGERLDLLEDRGLDIPINKKIRQLVKECYNELEKK